MSIAPPTRPKSPERPLEGLVKHSVIYSAAPILRQLISIGMTPFYTAWLGPAGAGVKENADLWSIALQQILGQNVLAGMMRFYFDQKDERQRAGVVTSCTLLILFVAFAICGIALSCVSWLTPALLGRGDIVSGSELERVCTLMLLLVPFQLGTVSGNYYLWALKRSGVYTAIQTVKLLFEIALNVWFMGVRGMGVTGFLLAMLIGEIVTSAGLVGWMLVKLRPRFDLEILRPILRYAAPLVPVGVLQMLLHQGDRRLVLEFLGQGPAGVYGFGFKIAFLVTNMLLGPFIVTWQPWIFGVEDQGERARLVSRVCTYAVLAIAAASLAVVLFGRQAALVLAGNPGFHHAYKVIPFLATAYVFWALYNVSQTTLFLAKRTGPLLVVNAAAVVLSFSLNWVLIPWLGIVGAGITALATFGALAVFGISVGRRSAGVHYEFGRLAAILACVIAGGSVALALDSLEDGGHAAAWLALALKGAALVVLLFVLGWGVLASDERAGLVDWMREKLRGRRGAEAR